MAYPAARKGDPITHDMQVPSGKIGPPLAGPCRMGSVTIEHLPAAHVGCTVICTGVIANGSVHTPTTPPPVIVSGSKTVFIHKLPAARWIMSGDVGECKVVLGMPSQVASRTVLIGG